MTAGSLIDRINALRPQYDEVGMAADLINCIVRMVKNHQTSEISVVSELGELDQFLEAMRDGAYSVTDSVMIQASVHLEELRAYCSTRKPVSIDNGGAASKDVQLDMVRPAPATEQLVDKTLREEEEWQKGYDAALADCQNEIKHLFINPTATQGTVSLGKCALSLKNMWLKTHDIGVNPGIAWCDLTKSVLDAAGVKYVDRSTN